MGLSTSLTPTSGWVTTRTLRFGRQKLLNIPVWYSSIPPGRCLEGRWSKPRVGPQSSTQGTSDWLGLVAKHSYGKWLRVTQIRSRSSKSDLTHWCVLWPHLAHTLEGCWRKPRVGPRSGDPWPPFCIGGLVKHSLGAGSESLETSHCRYIAFAQ